MTERIPRRPIPGGIPRDHVIGGGAPRSSPVEWMHVTACPCPHGTVTVRVGDMRMELTRQAAIHLAISLMQTMMIIDGVSHD